MEYRPLGSTGIRVSSLLLGCGNFGGIGSAPATRGRGDGEAWAFRLMDEALGMGINVFDTANSYAGGESERIIGRWLKTKGAAVKDKLHIATKVGSGLDDGSGGLSKSHILEQVDKSLARLGVECVDMYITHKTDPSTPIEETLEALTVLRDAGKVVHIGASNVSAAQLHQALDVSAENGFAAFEWIQNSYSMLDRSDEKEMFRLCRERKIGVTPYSPLAGGLLTGKYNFSVPYPAGSRMHLFDGYNRHLYTKEALEGVARLSDLAAEMGFSTAALALAWVMYSPGVDAPLVAPRNPEQLGAVKEALRIKMDGRAWQQIGAVVSVA